MNNFKFVGEVNESGPPPAGDDLYWTANGTTLGGSGTWDASGSNWSPTDTPVDPDAWDSSKQAIFTNSAGTVSVDEVSVEKGIKFATDGYVLEDGTISLDGATISDNTITTDANVTATIDSILTGSEGLAKAGAGTLVLGGSNDYEGGTLVAAGGLVGTTGSLQGDITNNGVLTFDQAANAGFAGDISGSGSLVKAGSGTVTLGGDNTYSGGTEVAEGGLTGTTGSLQGDIVNNGTVTFDQAGNGAYAGNMSGDGVLVKDGGGTVILGGTNSYTGGTEVALGGLTGTTASLQGDITNNGTVTFDQPGNGTYAGTMSGDGTLVKDGGGNVTLTGANSYTGGTEVLEGGLTGTTASLQGDIYNDGAVTFDQATSGTYAGELAGTGSVTKSGAGAVTFSGNNSYEGGTTVNGGTLIAAGNTALGTESVAITEGAVLAKDGVTTANDFVIGSASGGGDTVWVAGWDFQTTANGGTAINAAPNTPQVILANFGEQAGDATIYLDGTHGSSTWASPASNPQLTSFSGSIVNTTNAAVDAPNVMSTTTSGAASLALANSSANGQHIVFAFDMTNLSDLSLSYASQRTGTGFNEQQWAYSINGTDWIDFWTNDDIAASFALESAPSAITGLDNVSTAYLRLTLDGASNASGNNRLDNIILNATSPGEGSGSGTVGISEAGEALFTGNITANHDATLTAVEDGTAVFSGEISGSGAINKTGAGIVTFSGASANTQTGVVTVSAGTLELNKAADTTAIAGNLEIKSGAKLLISAGNQVVDTSNVTLSGGTIQRASGVDEVFGDLNLTEASFLDYGTGDTGTLTFGTYTPSSLLTVSNFLEGNKLVFSSNLTGQITGNFDFDNGFTTNWNGSTFTITAIPEPAAYAAAAGLIGLMLWPTRRRLLKDAKSILGFRPPARDRLAKRA